MDYRILGPLEVRDDGRLLELGGDKQRALLALLLLRRNEVVSADRLIDDLWGESPPARAVRTLQVYVSRLRKALHSNGAVPTTSLGDPSLGSDGGVLITRGHGYLLRVASGELDVDRFDELVERGRDGLAGGEPERAASVLREALGLWRGPPLADFAYEEFAQAPIAQLEELKLAAVEERVQADLALGRDRELVGELRELVERHPLRERLRGQLMLALYRCGRQGEALQAFHEFRQGLSAELGLEPSEALQLLERAILVRDTALELGARPFAGRSADKDGGVVVCPFRGLAFFDVGDAAYFYGHEQIVADLVSRLANGSFTGIVGSSGGGKSSILRAGLLSALADGVLPGSNGWRVALLRPGEHPVAELERALGTPDIAEALASLQPGERIVLAVDQLEEVFTACQDAEDRAAFLETLVNAALDPDRRAAVVVALRADFYGRCSEHPHFGELLSANHVLVGPMERGDLVRAIELPASRAELEIERPLVEALVGDVAGEPGGLPLLSTALLELWRQRDGRVLRYESYRTSGGVRGAVARLAEQAYARFDESERDAARAIMLRLCSGEPSTVVRRRVPLAELGADRNERVAHVLAILTEARLLTASDGDIEIAHEALLREWPRLRGWLEEDREGRRLHTHLAAAAGEWDARERDPAELYRGARLSAALEWTAHNATQLSAREREFIDASRTANERQLRRLRMLLGGVAVLLAVAVAAGIVALVQRQDARATARAAGSHALAAASQAQFGVDPERSILLAVAAVREAPTPEAVFALRGALDSPLERQLPSVGPQPAATWGPGVSYSPDGRRLAVGSQTGVVTIFAIPSGRVLHRVRLGAPAPVVAFSPDGKLLAVGTDNHVFILDASTGATRLTGTGLAATNGYLFNDFAFSADGSVLYFDDGYGVVRWDLRTNRTRLLRSSPGSSGPVGAELGVDKVALSPDGRRVVVGGWPGLALLDTATGRVLATAEEHRSVYWVAFSLDGSQLAVASGPDFPESADDGTLALLDPRTLAVRRVLRRIDGNTFTTLAFSPDGTKLAYGGGDGSAGIIELPSGAQLLTLPGHVSDVYQVAFSPDGRQLATAAGDGTTRLWRTGGNEQLAIPAGGFDTTINGNDVPADLRLLANRVLLRVAPLSRSAGGREQVRAWTLEGRPAAGQLAISQALPNGLARLSDDGRVAVTIPIDHVLYPTVGAAGARLQVWDVPGRRITRSIVIDPAIDDQLPPAVSPDDSQVALGVAGAKSSFGSAQAMELVNVATGRARRLRPTTLCIGWLTSGYSPNGRYLAAGTGCGQVYIWDTTTGRQVAYKAFSSTINLLAPRFSPDGSQLAIANTGNSGQVSILDVATDKVVTVLTAHTGQVEDIAYSPNSKLLATASIDHTVRIWDAHTGRPLRILYHPDPVDAVAFGPTSDTIATLDYAGTIRLWDACTDCESPTALLALAKQRITRQLTPAERRTFLGG